MTKIAIVDNDIDFYTTFLTLIERHISKIINDFEIEIISSDFKNNLLHQQFDLIFLDINLDDDTGISLANMLNEKRIKH